MMDAKSGNRCNNYWTVTVLFWSFILGWKPQWFSVSISISLSSPEIYLELPTIWQWVDLPHHLWQHKIKCCCDSTLSYWVSQPEANGTIALAIASSSPPFWPCCCQIGDSPVRAPLQGIRGSSFPTGVENLLILAPHHPSVLAMPESTHLWEV